jgi:hypothetical protein
MQNKHLHATSGSSTIRKRIKNTLELIFMEAEETWTEAPRINLRRLKRGWQEGS